MQFEFSKLQPASLLAPPFVSAVINDPADPAATKGILFVIKQKGTRLHPSEYVLTANSSNTTVIADTGIHINNGEDMATAYLFPSGIGYSDITFTVTCQKSSVSLVLHYAASAASITPASTVWHSGSSDASASISVGNNYMLVADDELDNLFLYRRHQSGLSISSFYYGDKLDLTDGSAPYFKEVDVEAGVASPRMPHRTYWTGSMSNSAGFNLKPNRNRLFAVDVNGTDSNAHCSLVGYYEDLREQLINWGNGNGYKFGKSAASGQNPKADNGFNVEAMTFAPDGTTLYIGFRAPLVPISDRKKAVIAPVENFETWFNGGKPKGKPTIGHAIELNLGGRSLRDMIRLSNGVYIILAGSSGDAHTGAVYRWSGVSTDTPMLLPGFDISKLNAEAVLEMDDEAGNIFPDRLQVLSDNGTAVYYGDNRPAKEFTQTAFRKFRSDIIMSQQPVLNK